MIAQVRRLRPEYCSGLPAPLEDLVGQTHERQAIAS
jgi:hypothetical protein